MSFENNSSQTLDNKQFEAVVIATGKTDKLNINRNYLSKKILNQELILYQADYYFSLKIKTTFILHEEDKSILIPIIEEKYPHFFNFITIKKNHGSGNAFLATKHLWNSENIFVSFANMPLVSFSHYISLLKNHTKLNSIASFYIVKTQKNNHSRPQVNTATKKNDLRLCYENSTLNDDFEINNNKLLYIDAGFYIFQKDFLLNNSQELIKDSFNKNYTVSDIINIALKINPEKTFPIISNQTEEDLLNFYPINDLYPSWVEKKLQEQFIENLCMSSGVSIERNTKPTIDCSVFIDKNTKLAGNITLLKKTTVGKNCSLRDVIIENSTIEDNVTIHPHSIIRNSIIKKNCTIGPFVHIHSNATVGPNENIDSFIEIKNNDIFVAANALINDNINNKKTLNTTKNTTAKNKKNLSFIPAKKSIDKGNLIYMIRFIHTADIHFGVENYGRIDPKTGIHTRLLDFEKALNFCIDTAIKEKVDFFLFSGDAYKTAHPTPTQQKLLFQCFLRLYDHAIPIVIIVGNHDHPLSFGKANALDIFSQFPSDGFHVISQPQTITLKTKSGPINIVGIPWPTRNTISMNPQQYQKNSQEITDYISSALATIIQKKAASLDQSIPAVLAGHLTVSSGIFSGSEKRAIYGNDPVLFPSQLAIKPFDYVALGHLHRYQNLNPNGHPAVIYSGSPERIDFGERKEDKGFCLVTIQDKKNTYHTFIKTPQRPFIQIELVLDNKTNQTDQMLSAIKKYDIKHAIVKIIYYVPNTIKDSIDLKLVHKNLYHAHYVVGIIPKYEAISRISRLNTTQSQTNLHELLETYFEGKPALNKDKKTLIQQALQLYQESIDPIKE